MHDENKQATRFHELLLGGEYDYVLPRPNQVVEGLILARDGGDLIVDIGAKRDALVPARDLQYVRRARSRRSRWARPSGDGDGRGAKPRT